ncbi:hypothetical protein [Streptomyces sp. NPDC002205]|uniref:LexA family protein n=1 Tax=Streptomyces sp. NPDC002205 TaxID=3154411 RepID=UPI00331B4F6C
MSRTPTCRTSRRCVVEVEEAVGDAWTADSAGRPTARQEAVLRAIRDVVADTGDAPTVREIGQASECPAPNSNGRHWRSCRLTGQRSGRTGQHRGGNAGCCTATTSGGGVPHPRHHLLVLSPRTGPGQILWSLHTE